MSMRPLFAMESPHYSTHPATSLSPPVWYLCFSRPVRLTVTAAAAGEGLGAIIGEVGLSEEHPDVLAVSVDSAPIIRSLHRPSYFRVEPRVDAITSATCKTYRR